jgi:Tol biopolymer transport system component
VIDPYMSGLTALGLTWLPDGSGFLYSAMEKDPDTLETFGNIFEFKFATQQSVRLTSFTSGFPRELTVSPDGQRVAFEYQATGDWSDLNPPIDLWMMNRDGSGATLFVENGHAPAWSPGPLPSYYYVYLPVLTR